MIRIFKKHWFLLALALLSVLLRLYKLEQLFYFTYDESIPAFIGKNFYIFHKIPLIGGVTPFGVHLTPYFYWLLALIISAGRLNPAWWGVVGAIGSSLTIFLIYLVGSEFFSKRTGVFASIIWAFSLMANIYDRHFWALYWGPILCMSTIFCLDKIIKKDKRYAIVLFLLLVWSIATDPSNLVFVFLWIVTYIIYRVKITKSEIAGVLIILLSLTPLLFFDLRHNFANTKPLLEYLKAEKSASRFESQTFLDRSQIFTNSSARLIYPLGIKEIAKEYSYCDSFIKQKYEAIPVFLKLIATLILISFIFLAFKSKKTQSRLLALTLAIYFFGIQAYGFMFSGDIFEHYLTGLFPVFILITAYYISILPKKVSFAFITIFLIFNVHSLVKAQNSHGLAFKKQAVNYVSYQLKSEPFSLESLSTCWRYSGYRYIFAAFGNEPVKSYVDPNLGHLYGSTPISPTHPDKIITVVTHDFISETDEFYRKYALYKSHEIKSSIFGNIEVIIMDNSSKWF